MRQKIKLDPSDVHKPDDREKTYVLLLRGPINKIILKFKMKPQIKDMTADTIAPKSDESLVLLEGPELPVSLIDSDNSRWVAIRIWMHKWNIK